MTNTTRGPSQPYRIPDGVRYFLDANGYGWREIQDNGHGLGVMHSMIPTNPDNSPTPEPLTYLTPVAGRHYRVVCAGGHVRSQSYDVMPEGRARAWDSSCSCGGPHVIESREMGYWQQTTRGSQP